MNKIENISLVIMEECAEVQQAISKCLRFGYDCYNPQFPNTNNGKDVLKEYFQLQAMMELLMEESGLKNYMTEKEIAETKKHKIEKFLEYQNRSIELEKVQE